jgi:hypothetical protein
MSFVCALSPSYWSWCARSAAGGEELGEEALGLALTLLGQDDRLCLADGIGDEPLWCSRSIAS